MSAAQGNITLESALAVKDDMILELSYYQKQKEFFKLLSNHQQAIEDLVRFHLSLHEEVHCDISDCSSWISGNFNVCIPVFVKSQIDETQTRVIIRIPLPYKLGETENVGNVEEKARCEAATYIWIKNNCSSVPIPRLWGFGFTSGSCVSFFFFQPSPIIIE